MRHIGIIFGLIFVGMATAVIQGGPVASGPSGQWALPAWHQVGQLARLEGEHFLHQIAELRQQLQSASSEEWSDHLWAAAGGMLRSGHGPLGQGIRYAVVLVAAYLVVQGVTLLLTQLINLSFMANLAMLVGLGLFLSGTFLSWGLVMMTIGVLLKFGQILDHFTPSRIAHIP